MNTGNSMNFIFSHSVILFLCYKIYFDSACKKDKEEEYSPNGAKIHDWATVLPEQEVKEDRNFALYWQNLEQGKEKTGQAVKATPHIK